MSEKNRKKPNILRVALRLILIAAFLLGAFFLYKTSGAETISGVRFYGAVALLACAAAVLIQLIVWGLKWTKNERVSELGLHIVRYAVILTAVALCVFVLLSYDYASLYSSTEGNELRQQAFAGRMYIQNALGESVEETPFYYDGVRQAAETLLTECAENDNRYVCLYLDTVGTAASEAGFSEYDGGYVCMSTSAEIPCSASAEVIDSVLKTASSGEAEEYRVGTYNIRAAYSPVYTLSGEPVGVLEICEIVRTRLDIFHFATLELCLKLLALIVFFSFSFYGCMQLVDILLRPKKFDKSRKVLSCGRESARPVLFFVAFSAALPVMMLLFADNVRSLMDGYSLPWGIGAYVPFMVYLLGICIGQIFGRKTRSTLSEIPADAGLVFSFLCNLALCMFMDWKKLSGLGLGRNAVLMLVLIFVSGLGYGIAYRITSKFQAQSDALFGYDKYIYLCSCLGAISGVVLGALMIENYSNVALRAVSCLLTAFTAVISIILLEDLKTTVDIADSCKNTLTSYAGGVIGVLPTGAACCFVWIYLTGFMFENNISPAAIGFCAVAPVIAFCFGNRLRLKHRTAQRSTLVISSLLSAASFVPMVFYPSFKMAVVSCAIVCVAVIFAASGVYSMTRHVELRKMTFRLLPFTYLGVLLAALALNAGNTHINLCSAVIGCVVLMVVFLLSKFPSRPTVQKVHPAITDGSEPTVPPMPVYVSPEPEPEPEKEKKKESRRERKKKEEAAAAAVIAEDKSEDKPTDAPEEKPEDKPTEKTEEETVLTPIIDAPEQEEKTEEHADESSHSPETAEKAADDLSIDIDELSHMRETSSADAREEAIRRAREQWQNYSGMAAENEEDEAPPVIFPD